MKMIFKKLAFISPEGIIWLHPTPRTSSRLTSGVMARGVGETCDLLPRGNNKRRRRYVFSVKGDCVAALNEND